MGSSERGSVWYISPGSLRKKEEERGSGSVICSPDQTPSVAYLLTILPFLHSELSPPTCFRGKPEEGGGPAEKKQPSTNVKCRMFLVHRSPFGDGRQCKANMSRTARRIKLSLQDYRSNTPGLIEHSMLACMHASIHANGNTSGKFAVRASCMMYK